MKLLGKFLLGNERFPRTRLSNNEVEIQVFGTEALESAVSQGHPFPV